jgi:hypothetical protein
MAGGGFHIKYRKTNHGIYNAVEGEIQLPTDLKADKKEDTILDKYGNKIRQNICPEFFFGMYKDVYIGKDKNGNDLYIHYGLDAGIVFFPSNDFKLTINMFGTTSGEYDNEGEPVTWFEENLPTVNPGDIVYLEVFLIPNKIFLIARNAITRRRLGILMAPLNENAFNAINAGSYINRESVMASNLEDNQYVPSGAYFSKATWRKTKITNAQTHEVIHLTEQNSFLKEPYDDHEKYKKYGKRPYGFKCGGYTVTEPGNDGLGDFVADVSYGDCRNK